ncbi:MAG: hypothetical protein LBI54_04095 [Lachnospiraceae bacterium]|nr:hypothetical protein [Lachnospiraceae bacterium]
MKSYTKKIISMAVAIIILLSNSTSVMAMSQTYSFAREDRMQVLFSAKLIEMIDESEARGGTADGVAETISKIKRITDFAGNQYTLVECSPTGYMIFHIESGIFTEYSATAPSPYLGEEGNFYYLGLKGYYVENKKDNAFVHTKLDEVLLESDIQELKTISNSINDKLCNLPDVNVTS